MASNRGKQPGGGGMLTVAGAGLVMVACCALPALIAGGAVAGIGGVLRSPWVIGAGVTILLIALIMTARRSSHHKAPD